MQSFRFVVMRWIAIFAIVVGVVGVFSSVWSGVQEYVFQGGMLTDSFSNCVKISEAGDGSQNVENVPNFQVQVNGTRYECYDYTPTQDLSSLRYQVPGIFTFGMIILFGAMMFRYANKQVNGTKSDATIAPA